ncbi:MAG: DegT/DnrJ/EryC1/StrS aminotransferase [Porticoccus sp.]|nr:MAG: DegT/DnrJ/EryC1/StrS aminotransferase [Porticoccus sp.]
MNKTNLAILGGRPAFAQSIPVGQLYFPSWARYEKAMRGIFDRQYYTNHGPLVQKLENSLQEFLGVKHVICVTNATIGLMMAADALELSGKVILPSFTFIASAQSLSWAGIEPVFCDVEPDTHQMAIEQLDALMDDDVSAIMGVNLWGGACNLGDLDLFAKENNIKLYFDSAHAFGCEVSAGKIAKFGSLEVFSFHATKILSATEGGSVCTNDDELAARLRNIRSSYGAGKPVPVVRTSNGRMSEAQAAIALMSLEDFSENRQNNEVLFNLYEKYLNKIPGISLIKPTGVTVSNYQYVVCEIDENKFGLSRDQLISALKAENVIARRYFYPGVHHTVGYENNKTSLPVTDQLCSTCIQLPIGAMVDEGKVEKICDLISQIQEMADSLTTHLNGRGA